MSFSDNTLMRLKADMSCKCGPEGCMHLIYGPPEVLSLLARLEAAEAVITDAENNLGVVNPLLVNLWRESADKEETIL